MRWLFWILLIMALATGVSLLAGSNQGYVLIVRPPYRLELSLNFLLVLIVLAFVSLHLVLRLIQYTRGLPASVRSYKERQRLKSGHAALLQSLHAITEGHYASAEKAAARALELGEDPALSSLIAARASHKLQHRSQRDYYLAEAERLAPQAAISRLLTQAELLLDDRQYSQALQVLQRLEKIEGRHAPALRLELKIRLRLQHWEKVLGLLQQLEKQDGIESWQAREYRLQAHLHLLGRHGETLAELQNYWKQVAEEDRLHPRLAQVAAQAFIALGAGTEAHEALARSLTREWSSELAALLGDCETDKPLEQLQQAEHWLLQHAQDASLLLSLGRMCIRLSLWGKAQSYLEASISVKPSAAAHLTLARLLENQGDTKTAFDHYRQSVRFCQQPA